MKRSERTANAAVRQASLRPVVSGLSNLRDTLLRRCDSCDFGGTMSHQVMRHCARGMIALLVTFMTTIGVATADCDAMPGPGVDWAGCDKLKTTLAGIDFTGANLDEAVLARTDLRKSDFSEAKLN